MSCFAFSSPASRVDQPSERSIWRCSSDPAGGRVMRSRSVLGSYEESRHVISVGLDGRSNNPIGTWNRGAAGSGELQETRAGRDSRARDSTQPESEVDGDATSSGLLF